MTEFADFLVRARQDVDAALDRWLPAESAAPVRLHQAMRYAVFGGGKRLRPVCVLLGATAVGGDVERAGPAAAAIEMVHTYSLIHDDLPCMDDDDLRRGRPTVHRAYDEALAVLAGDALLTHAFSVLATELPASIAVVAVRTLARRAGALGMVGGQVDDLAAEGRELDATAIRSIDERKTAALFQAAFEMGGHCGGADERDLEILGRVGMELGIAFQIVDDLLDRRSSTERLGKAAGKDRARGKATLVDRLGEEVAAAEAGGRTEAAIGLCAELPKAELIQELARTMLQRSH